MLLCIWASRCPLTADHWHLNSSMCESCRIAVLALSGESDTNQCECMGKNRYTCVFLLYSSHRCLWLLVNASCWGLNHTSAKCGFYQIIRVLNHCLPTIVLTEECERGNKLLHRVGACVCVTDSVVISDVTEQQTTTCFIASQPLSMSICNITNANITLN